MAQRHGLTAYLDAEAAAGRYGDTELAHFSKDELDLMDTLQGGRSINPVTGRREYFSFGKVLKGVAKAAAAIAGGYFGGPVGSAIGAGAVSKLLGDNTSTALSTGLLAGLGSWGAQQTGIGDIVGGGFSSGASLLGQEAADAGIQTASAVADNVASSGGGMGLSAVLPALGIGAAALGAGAAKPPKSESIDPPDEPEFEEYEPLDREQMAYAGDPYSYGVFGPEFQYFDEVNPGIQPMRDGGRVAYKYGGNVSEGGKTAGGHESGGQGPNADRGGKMGRDSSQRGIGAREAMTGPGRGAPSGISDNERRGREQYSKSMQQGNMANLAGPHGYGAAVDKFQQRGGLWDVLDFIGGPFIDVNPPDVTNPDSYANGDWHTSTNVGGALGAIGGMALGVPGLGMAGSWVDDQLGIPDIYHGGPGYVSDAARAYNESMGGGGAQTPSAGGTGQGGFGAVGLPAQIIAGATAGASSSPGKSQDQSTPLSPTGRTYVPLADVYNYGIFGPEHQFFTGEIPMQDLNMRNGGDVRGPGTGQSDDIPAMLSDGEYVIDAETVSALGDGSTEAGAAKLDAFRKNLRAHKRKTPANKIPPVARSIGDYMRSAA